LVADVAENAADDGDQGNNRGRFENLFFFCQRKGSLGPKPSNDNELTGKS
jgi:hypothetical protein